MRRGFLKTEIGRVLNRLIALKRPAHLVLERLDFRAPGLSRRLNRILARSGRAVIRARRIWIRMPSSRPTRYPPTSGLLRGTPT